MKIKSPEFSHQMFIPTRFTCNGNNLSPPLIWYDPPENTQSFSLIVEDPDAPDKTFIHWVIYNIPSFITLLPEGIPREKYLLNSARQAENDFGNLGYDGPCPPSGVHRYYFTLYALDNLIDTPPGTSSEKIKMDLNNHIIATATLMGRYNNL